MDDGGVRDRTAGAGVWPRSAGTRTVVYCLVPRELALKLHDPLRDHFRDDPRVEVVVERRERDRRAGAERRVATAEVAPAVERRRIRNATGRRISDRRATSMDVQAPPLPRRARRYADQLRFVERLEPATRESEDVEAGRLVVRFQQGDRAAFETLYSRYFDRVYGYLKMMLRDRHEAEDLTQQVFMRLFEKLDEYERREQPFWSWLVTVVRNTAISHMRKSGRLEVEDPVTTQRRIENGGDSSQEDPGAVRWIQDRDLLLFVERLPAAQKQVLLLRFMLDLPSKEVAQILGRNPEEVRKLQHRALTFLRARLAAVGRAPERRERPTPWRRRVTQVRSSRARRYALLS
jgi:RNA polymerase sigma-70 factor (ECF subfamily)